MMLAYHCEIPVLTAVAIWHLAPEGSSTALCGMQMTGEPLGNYNPGALMVAAKYLCAECRQKAEAEDGK